MTDKPTENAPSTGSPGSTGEAKGAEPSSQPSATAKKIVTLTPAAETEVKRLVDLEGEGIGLRLGIKGGGCSGLTYSLDFTAMKDGDTVIDYEGFQVFLDKKSTIYLSGVTLDFQSGLQGRGFVFQNPHASNTCGCGESFSL